MVPVIQHVVNLNIVLLVREELIFQTVKDAFKQPSKYDCHWQVKEDEIGSTDDVNCKWVLQSALAGVGHAKKLIDEEIQSVD